VPRRCLNRPDTFCYVCGELTFNSEAKFYPAHEEMLGALFGYKVGDQDKSCAPLCLLCNVCKDSYRMGIWFAPNAVHRSHGLEGTRRPLVRLLLLFNRQNTDDMQIRTPSEMSRSAICNKACPTQ
jgi:hypothetical protein